MGKRLRLFFIFAFIIFLIDLSSAELSCSYSNGQRVGPADGESLDQLGTAVAISGNTAFLGIQELVNFYFMTHTFKTDEELYVISTVAGFIGGQY